MRYINKEYGFTFRPPYFDKFYEEKTVGSEITSDNFPNKYLQGVGYDYSAINGAMIVGKNGSLWGIKVSYFNGKKWLDNDDFMLNMGSGCASTADGSFSHFSSGPLSVKWVKHNEQSLLVQVSARKKLRVRVVFYPCYGWFGELSIEGSYVKGRSPHIAVVPGTISLNNVTAVYKDRYQVVMDNSSEKEFFMAQSYNKPSDSANGAFNEAIMEFVINRHQSSIYLYVAVGDENIFNAEVPRMDKVIKQIETAELRYGVNKTMGSGALGISTERMLNSVLWSRIYYPYLLKEIYSPKRKSLNNHFDIQGMEENCSCLLGNIAGGNTRAFEQVKVTLEDKLMSILTVWHTISHSFDKTDVLYLYKNLVKLHPPTETLVLANDSDKSEIAYMWEDSPLKEKYNSTPMYSLDMSCMKLLAFDILERIAVMFDLPESDKYCKAKKTIITMINETFWNDREGLYVNRYLTGQWANNYGATSFYPLIAGAVDDGNKLSRLVNNLTDTRKFWSEYAVTTLIMNNPQFGKRGKPNNNGHRNPPYLKYRGSIVPHVNYLIYHGLVRYGLDEIAGQVAFKSAKLWANNESDNVENFSMYLPNGHRVKAKEYLSSNGNMLALIGMQELIDLEYFRNDLQTRSLKFGTFISGTHSLTNLKLIDKIYSIEVDDNATTFIMDNVPMFRGEGGKFVVRNFLETRNGCEFMIDCHSNISINLVLPTGIGGKKQTKYFFIAPIGKSKIVAENEMVNILQIQKIEK